MSNDYELPPMPEPAGPDVGWFTEDQMREYALLAVQRERERCARLVESFATCPCNGDSGYCAENDPPRAFAKAIRKS
jgi:hypothetical protein